MVEQVQEVGLGQMCGRKDIRGGAMTFAFRCRRDRGMSWWGVRKGSWYIRNKAGEDTGGSFSC